jgi:hypothetical protein
MVDINKVPLKTFRQVYISRKEPLLFQPSSVDQSQEEKFTPNFGSESKSKITVKARSNAFMTDENIKFQVHLDNTEG